MAKYRLKVERLGRPAGTICYTYHGCDYGLASDDTRDTGQEHISVVDNDKNETPFFTVYLADLEQLDE